MASNKDKKSGSNTISSGEIVKNKKALFNYELVEKFEAGIVLLGTEVKSLRERSVNMSDSYASFKKGELFIDGKNHSQQRPLSGPGKSTGQVGPPQPPGQFPHQGTLLRGGQAVLRLPGG